MPTFNYSSGNINNLVSSGTASMADIQGPLVDVRDFINGQLGDSNLSSSAAIQESKLANGSTGLAKGAFSAYRNAATSLADAATIVFDTEEFDVSGWFDTATGIYTPLLGSAAIYRFSWRIQTSGVFATTQYARGDLMKNAAIIKLGQNGQSTGTISGSSVGSALVSLNGTTDAVRLIFSQNVGSAQPLQVGQPYITWLQGELVGRT